MGYRIQFLEHPSDAHIEEIVSICLRAFENDIPVKSMVGGDTSLHLPLFYAMVRPAALFETVYVALDEAGTIVGVSLWIPPGRELLSSEEQLSLGFNEFMAGLDTKTKEWWRDIWNGERVEFFERSLGPEVMLNSWYANLVAVHPKHQRRGIAAMLIDVGYQRAIKENSYVTIAAENEVNAKIYIKMGFELKGRIELKGLKPEDDMVSSCFTRYP